MVLENKTGHVVTVVNSFTQTEIPIDEKAEIDVSDGGLCTLRFFLKKNGQQNPRWRLKIR